MTTSFLGTTPVHRIGFGAMQLAGPDAFGPPADAATSTAVLRRAVEQGVTHIDTAQYYGPDIVNDLIREALHPYPDDLILATKVGAVRDDQGEWLPRGAPDDLKHQVEQNLRSLRVERLGLVNLRRFEGDAPALEDQLGALLELRDEGKLDLLGISNVDAETARAAIRRADVVSVQNSYSLLDRADESILEICRENSIAFVPFFPLGSAYGTGGPKHLAADPHVGAVAHKHGITPTQVALAWLLAQYERMLLIPGTSSLAHLDENLAVDAITLDADDLVTLEAVTPVPFWE